MANIDLPLSSEYGMSPAYVMATSTCRYLLTARTTDRKTPPELYGRRASVTTRPRASERGTGSNTHLSLGVNRRKYRRFALVEITILIGCKPVLPSGSA